MKTLHGRWLSYFLMYFFYYGGMALMSGLISVYLFDKGFSASQTSLVVSCAYISSIVLQPVLGHLSDQFDKRRINAAALVIAAVFGLFFARLDDLLWITVIYSIIVSALNGCNPVIESFATTSRYPYASIRIWGSVGYAVSYYASGLLYRYFTADIMYALCSCCIIVCTIGVWNTEDAAAPADTEHSACRAAGTLPGTLHSIFTKDFCIYLLLSGIFWGAANAHGIYIPAVLTAGGLPVDRMSLVIGLATLMELPAIYFSAKVINRLHNKTLLCLEFGLLILQFLVFSFSPGLPVQILTTILTKSVTGMLFIMVNMKITATLSQPQYQITALGIAAAVKSLASILFQQLSGMLIDRYSYAAFYQVLLVSSIVGLMLTAVSRMPGGKEVKLYH